MLTKLRQKLKFSESGFTLIELLVVILIIGVLAAIAIPVFLNQQKAAVDAATKSDIKSVSIMVRTWMAENPGSTVPGSNLKVGPGEEGYAWVTEETKLGNMKTTLSKGTILGFNGDSETYYVCAYNLSGGKYSSNATNLCWKNEQQWIVGPWY